jgi:hypothetical protein
VVELRPFKASAPTPKVGGGSDHEEVAVPKGKNRAQEMPLNLGFSFTAA